MFIAVLKPSCYTCKNSLCENMWVNIFAGVLAFQGNQPHMIKTVTGIKVLTINIGTATDHTMNMLFKLD